MERLSNLPEITGPVSVRAGPTQAVRSRILPSTIRQHNLSIPWPNANQDVAPHWGPLEYSPAHHTTHKASHKHQYSQSSSIKHADAPTRSTVPVDWTEQGGPAQRTMAPLVVAGITERQSQLAQQPAIPPGEEKEERNGKFPIVVSALGW